MRKVIDIQKNPPGVLIVNALWDRVVIRRYSRHSYVIVFGKIVFDWWPYDDKNRLQLFGRTVRQFELKAKP